MRTTTTITALLASAGLVLAACAGEADEAANGGDIPAAAGNGQDEHDNGHDHGDDEHNDDEPEPIAGEPLTDRHEFTDDVAATLSLGFDDRDDVEVERDDASHLAVFQFTIQPGAKFPWHTHPGSGMIAVTEGDLHFIYPDDCVERPYPAGTAFVDAGDDVHMALNPSDTEETVVVATFFGVPEDGELTLPVDDDEGAELDEACGIDR